MRFARIHLDGRRGLALEKDGQLTGLFDDDASFPGTLDALVSNGPVVTGAPSGVGAARKPTLWMKAGDVCTISIEKLGVLENRIIDEVA